MTVSIWARIAGAADAGAGAAGVLVDRVLSVFADGGDPRLRRGAAFSIAMIALSAKMARADGIVTADEVAAFRQVLAVPPAEERNVARLFDLAKKDVAGFESYAAKIARIYGNDRLGLEDVVDGLFFIAAADEAIHERELAYLERIGTIFGLTEAAFERIVARHVIPEEGDPYAILGVERTSTVGEIRRRYRQLAAENHPDRLIGRGLPIEAEAIAHRRMAAINLAWERIRLERA